jgi:2-polyprenyl-6-methoxyphenol hydroxylase-like FAD-dependent oxidoreductase
VYDLLRLMADRFDVIVVGARCAGSPLAALLARQGVKVALLERASFPRDTLSSHVFQAPAINLLHRLGVLGQAQAAGAPCLERLDFRQSDFCIRTRYPKRPGDAGGFMSVRRFVLDPLLADAAAAAGAEVMMAAKVVGLAEEHGRVAGVRALSGDREHTLMARLVIGADGRNSTVGRLVGARKYHVVPGRRFAYWGFFEGVETEPEPEIVFHHWDGRVVIACPTDSGLYQVILVPDRRFLPEFQADRDRAFLAHARACAPVAASLAGAQRVGKLLGIVRFESFFRESAGPGWGLVGDAGQFKDPTPGQGMTDAFRQAAALAPMVAGALGGSDAELDAAVAGWARWRDHDAIGHHWLACDMGAPGEQPRLLTTVMERFAARGEFGAFADILQHPALPARVVTPLRLLAATAAMLARPGADHRRILRELNQLVANDRRRKRLYRRPVFVDSRVHADAGETEVAEALAA